MDSRHPHKSKEDKQKALVPYHDTNNIFQRLLHAQHPSPPKEISCQLVDILKQDENPLKKLDGFNCLTTFSISPYNTENYLHVGLYGIECGPHNQVDFDKAEKQKRYIQYTYQSFKKLFNETLPVLLYQAFCASDNFEPDLVKIILSYAGTLEDFYSYQSSDTLKSLQQLERTSFRPTFFSRISFHSNDNSLSITSKEALETSIRTFYF